MDREGGCGTVLHRWVANESVVPYNIFGLLGSRNFEPSKNNVENDLCPITPISMPEKNEMSRLSERTDFQLRELKAAMNCTSQQQQRMGASIGRQLRTCTRGLLPRRSSCPVHVLSESCAIHAAARVRAQRATRTDWSTRLGSLHRAPHPEGAQASGQAATRRRLRPRGPAGD